MRQFPARLWLFTAGFLLVSVAPLLPHVPYMPANPLGVFAAAAAVLLIWRGDGKSYRVAVATAFLAVWYPVLVLSSWMTAGGPPALVEVLWVFVTPALLLSLLFTPAVRRYAGLGADRGSPAG